jgi:outer membrane protein OmpA-like peptidoglycan-associated protein
MPDLEKGIYLVIGAFGVESNAAQYANRANNMGVDAGAGYHREKGLYYVYAFYSPDSRDDVLARYHEVRKKPEYHDAWIMYVDIERPVEPQQDVAFEPLETAPATVPVVEEDTPEEPPSEPEPQPVVVEEPEEEPVQVEPGTYPFLFNVTNATTLKEVSGFIQIVDAERGQQYQTVNTNRVELIEEPNTSTKMVLAVCDIFGYVKQQAEFKIDEPLRDANPAVISREGGTTIVRFPLQRYHKGDIMTMYNVYFYNDAAIMKPESKYELNSLLDMLRENENYQIKLHGHTNGNNPGKIIKLAEDDDNFFTVTDSNISGYGSSKELSTERALTIKRWLEEQGVNPKRVSIKGWGGKKMIYKKNDPLAKRNIRVEVEILRE